MNYPLDAFKTVVPSQAPSGTLFRCQGVWAIKADPVQIQGQEVGQMLMLDGRYPGAVAVAPDREALALADGYDWMVFTDLIAVAVHAQHLPAVRITPNGPLIYGHAWGRRDVLMAVTQGGQHLEEAGYDFFIQNFSIWLVDDAKRQVGSHPLVRVSTPAPALL
ncbi:hypothetical protein V3O09_12265 [Stenotrophomonas maltophilia]|uniref:hypothetical protein n=1 Tax=Stenotrophomonas maltophilia TaxID=40324 RepID=UPI0005CB6706|nr:hypothetical protein [Stenotrophomonas maltophilia]